MSTARLIECLLQGEVESVVIGGVAAVLHGSTLVIRDLDICIPLGFESLLKLQAALKPTNPRVRARADWVPLEIDASRTEQLKELSISTDEGRSHDLEAVIQLKAIREQGGASGYDRPDSQGLATEEEGGGGSGN